MRLNRLQNGGATVIRQSQFRYDVVMRRHSRNLRTLARVGLFLLLGAILNVAAAWSMAAKYYFRLNGEEVLSASPTGEQIRWWKANISPGIDDEPKVVERDVSIGFDWEWMNSRVDGSGPIASRWRSGIPFRSLGFHTWTLDGRRNGGARWEFRGMWTVGADLFAGHRPLLLPLDPLWPGFLINTLLYAGLLWLGIASLEWHRRFRRMRRGLCPACAYPIGKSLVCTECGAALPVSSAKQD